MTVKEKTIYVYDDFSCDIPVLLGRLYVDVMKGNESYSFEYNDEWLKNTKLSVSLDPNLMPYGGRQFPSGKGIFGMFADASPDRWGRVLMTKKERLLADKEERKPRKLGDSDFLLGVYDETRMGGLRFKLDPEGEFLSNDKETATPPWATLRNLEEASRQFENDTTKLNEKWLNQLLRPGSSLGGARPKATVVDTEGNLWIAKFPSRNDDNDVGAWEKVVHDLAGMCGLNVPESKLETFSKLGSTFLVKRFDRLGERRIHFASAMTLLDKNDGASAADGTSYLDIVSFINANGAKPKEDLLELWKRIVFNMAVSNIDDHLRNHAFILSKHGWVLSPLYDVNPVPYGEDLSINVNDTESTISVALAVDTAVHFGIQENDAREIANEILSIVRENWEKLAKQYGIPRGKIEDMRPAFSECYKIPILI